METSSPSGFEFGPYRVEPAERRLTHHGEPIRIPPKALEMLIVLVGRAGRVVSKEDLLAAVWPGTFVEEGNLTVNMTTLRRALADGDYIETVPKLGYRFSADVRVLGMPSAAPSATEPAALAVVDFMPGAPVPLPRPRTPLNWHWPAVAAALGILTIGGWSLARSRPTVVSSGSVNSLAVLPFRAIAPAEDLAYLESGMADALSSRLGSVSGLRVPPLTAARSNEDPLVAGARLAVDAVLTGSVQRAGDRLRVSVHLHRVSDRSAVWTAQFDEKFTDILSVQDAIAQRISSAVRRNVTAADSLAARRGMTQNPQAYDLYLRAREQWSRRTPDSVRSAIRMYQTAISMDPSFALAYAGLADAYAITRSGLSSVTRYPLALGAAERALALDPELAEANTAAGFIYYKFEHDWSNAEVRFKRALAAKPDYALAHHWYGEMLFLVGRGDESVVELTRAYELDPDSAAIARDLVRSLLYMGRVPDAAGVVAEGLAFQPAENQLHLAHGDVLAAQGQEAAAEEARWRAGLLQGVPEGEILAQRAAYKAGGIRAMLARQIASMTLDWQRNTPGIATRLARANARLGNRDQTLAWLRKAIDLGEDAAHQLKVVKDFDFIRHDPAFKAMLKEAALN